MNISKFKEIKPLYKRRQNIIANKLYSLSENDIWNDKLF